MGGLRTFFPVAQDGAFAFDVAPQDVEQRRRPCLARLDVKDGFGCQPCTGSAHQCTQGRCQARPRPMLTPGRFGNANLGVSFGQFCSTIAMQTSYSDLV